MFNLNSVSGKARCGEMNTKHGKIKTPFFMPVATKGTMKWVSLEELIELNFECFISNSFLLSRKPGLNLLKKAKGYHKFINWNKSIFTDSGGFQLLDETFLHKITKKGVWLKDPFTMEKVLLTPQNSAEIQSIIGSDIAMVLDDVRHPHKSKQEHIEAVKNTINWAKEFKENQNEKMNSFAIVQGGLNLDLRKKCAEALTELNFDGYALGGLCIGESREEMFPVIKKSIDFLPKEKPRYLMGVGSPLDLLKAIELGVDCFDSAFPTKSARHGLIFSSEGNYNLTKAKNALDFNPLDKNCKCKVCRKHSRAYLHHLLKVKEETALHYLSYHNLYYVEELIKNTRTAINEGNYSKFVKEFEKR
ncbi:MAG: tRNA guanosine(34) transglycosylase Tgt [Candidatus Diapherotrites archaeon]|nr:tRNA guanosine(34) transglycosylase Tgt [Candidatus Diapherotrites archaeon]